MPTLSALRQYAAIVDLDGDQPGKATARTGGTFPTPGGDGDDTGQGTAIDRNGQEYRWHNFMVMEWETYQLLAEEHGEDQNIPWETLYEYGFGASEFTRVTDLERGLPRGLPAEVIVQRQVDPETGEVQLNVISHEMQEINQQADVFAEEKETTSRPVDNGAPVTEEERVTA